MVYGEGSPIGPDLSNVARKMTVDEIREALLQPDARITPGYRAHHCTSERWPDASRVRAKQDQLRHPVCRTWRVCFTRSRLIKYRDHGGKEFADATREGGAG